MSSKAGKMAKRIRNGEFGYSAVNRFDYFTDFMGAKMYTDSNVGMSRNTIDILEKAAKKYESKRFFGVNPKTPFAMAVSYRPPMCMGTYFLGFETKDEMFNVAYDILEMLRGKNNSDLNRNEKFIEKLCDSNDKDNSTCKYTTVFLMDDFNDYPRLNLGNASQFYNAASEKLF